MRKTANAITVCIMNGKGGCGKSTIATNLSAYLSMLKNNIMLVDYDVQQSSCKWLQERPSHLPNIKGVDAVKSSKFSQTNSIWSLNVSSEIDYVILDTPAGVDGFSMDDILRKTNLVIIPVLPSAHDIRATSEFIGKLLLNHTMRRMGIKIAVVANRVNKTSLEFHQLQKFLFSLKIPFVSVFSESRYYLQAAEQGVGMCEIATKNKDSELFEWEQLHTWIKNNSTTGNPSFSKKPSFFRKKLF